MDKKSFFYKSRHDPDLNFIFVKRDREARLSGKWEDHRIKKIEEAAKKGRIADKAVFRTINKEQCYRFGLSVDEGWALYKKSWCLLMGLKPTANVDRFFRREHPSTAAVAAAVAAAPAAAAAAAVAAAVDDYFDDVPGGVVDDGGNNYEFEGDAYVPTSPPSAPPPEDGDDGDDDSTSSSEEDEDVSSPETPSTPATP
jgi:hypothetical protein